MNFNDTIKERMANWPRKLTSVMDVQRQRFSELNKKFKPTPAMGNSSKLQPILLPQTSRPQPRPQPRQQARSKAPIPLHLPPTRRSNTAREAKYLTLANISDVLHVFKIDEKSKEQSDLTTETSASTSTSAKQRVQQHLQETATRWWRPIRSSDSQLQSSIVHSSVVSTTMQQYNEESMQSQGKIPLLTVVSNSTQQVTAPSKYAESDVSTEIAPTNVITSVKIFSLQRTRQEALLFQARGMHLHSSDHHRYLNHMNFFGPQQRLIRQA